jgi:glycosyltransferase involved in cell wall biosynthesis
MQRSPNLVFEALAALRQDDPTLTQRLQLIFMTQFKPEHSFAIESLKLHEIVQNRGLGPYRDALKLQASADALLVLEGVAQNVEIMLTQKIFEYLAAEKPVLAIAPPGALADLINATGVGEVISPGDVTKIKEALKRLMNGTFHFAPDRERIATFSRRNQAGQLASILRHMK